MIDPEAPVAAGHAALPLPGDGSPLAERPLHGLYAVEPSPDTRQRLAEAPLSPDGRFRSLLVDGSAWVARVDGAWIWQIEVPPPAQPQPGQAQSGQAQPGQPQPGQAVPGQAVPGQTAPGQPPAVPAQVVGPLQWTPRSTLLFRDSNGLWQEADPATALVTPFSPAFQGASSLSLSPDGRQVLFYKGKQLFTAHRDGSQLRLIGENLIGHWGADNQLVTTKAGSATSPPANPEAQRSLPE